MTTQKWNGVQGKLVLMATLELPFTSSGWHNSGKISGPPEDCYPPEGEDERSYCESANLFLPDGSLLRLTKEQTEELLSHLSEEVQDVEIWIN